MQNQPGFSTTNVLLFLILVSILGFGSYSIWNSKHSSATTTDISSVTPSPTVDTGGPALGHVRTTTIEFTTGVWDPAAIDIKKGSTVTWKMSVGGYTSPVAVESDKTSSESFSSPDLNTNGTFTHTFNTVGVFGWHDTYNGNLSGYTITVTE